MVAENWSSRLADKQDFEFTELDRAEVELQAHISIGQGGPRETGFAFIITDLSVGGFSGLTPNLVPIGEDMVVDMGRFGSMRGTVAWAIGGRFGCKFLTPLPETTLAEMTAA